MRKPLLAVLAFLGIVLLTVAFQLSRETAEPGHARAPTSLPGALCSDLYSVVCSRETRRDPTGIVRSDLEGETLAMKEYESIVHAHPEWNADQVDEELVKLIYTPERRGAIVTNARWVRSALDRFIESQPESVFSGLEKRRLKSRLKRVELDLPPPAKAYADEPDLFTKNDVFYERLLNGRLRLRVGGAYLFTARSRFNQIFTLAHELAHSIDPCEMRVARFSLPSYDRLSACFLQRKLIAARRTRAECGQDDQLSETFADWVAVQIIPEAIRELTPDYTPEQKLNALLNSVRDLCEQDASDPVSDLTYHPSPKTRIQGIFGHSPAILEMLGCNPVPARLLDAECGFDWTPPPIDHPRKNL